ncbi:ABC transporter permease [Anianabacter salinae]|uniref:ABC transporter permease n=1 Tax=Anianabacter salinae TaxID=2851023 RepID=UPI00225DD409|nr:FtsX-like permease family protein [Anianabacter salinae]MBV0910869.1 FtsX-like permease family protein [Anianabacter salinae]
MTLPVPVRIALRELRGGLRGFRVFLACLALGVAAIAAVGSVRASIEQGLAREGAVLLGGDAEVELTYRFATEEERAYFDSLATRVSEVVDFRSMATVQEGGETLRGLTQIKGVDGAYPLLGEVQLDPPMPLDQALAGDSAVMDRVLIDRLGLAVGDTFRLGSKDFTLSAVLTREPDNTVGGLELGPRTLVRTEALDGSGLLATGTLFESQYRLNLPEGASLDELKRQTETRFEGAVRWRDSRNGAPGVSRFVDRLGAFLVLVGLAGLAVGGVGVSAAVTAYIDRKTAVIATLKTLGAETRTIFAVYAVQIGLLTLAGVVVGLILGALVPIALAPVLADQLPVPAEISIYWQPLAEAALYGLLAAALFTLWPLARTEQVRAATLFRDAGGAAQGWPRPRYILLSVILFAALVGSAALLSGVPDLTLWAAAGIVGAFFTLVLAARLIRRLARRAARSTAVRGRSALRLALGSVGGPGSEAVSVVLSLGLGLTVLAAVGQIDANLRGAIQRELPDIAPSYFVVDIQNDQLGGFMDRVQNDPGVEKVETAPMLRGVITSVNGTPARDFADHWVLRGDRGVTYSATPGPNTTITAGEWWPEDYDGPNQVSFAAEEAAEIGLQLGDEITVNILGRDISATVTSFRVVDFSTAGIGFVMSMSPNALAGAPHTSIATIYAEPEAEAALIRDIGQAYPNITMIRVRDAIDRVSEILAGVAAAVTYGALATLITGLIVLIGAAAAGERARTYEAAILKTLGASRRTVLVNFALRSAMFGLAAGIVAIVAGGVAGWAVTTFVMEAEFRFEPGSAIAIVVGGAAMTLLAGLAFAWRPLAARPARVLRASE